MRPAADSYEFLATPVGRYVAGRTWLLWCADPTICGSVLWGRLGGADIDRLLIPLDSLFSQQMALRCQVLSDASRLEMITASAFKVFIDFIQHRLPEYGARIARQAMVRPSGLPGALVGGLYEVLGQPSYPVRVFTNAIDALRWLRRPDATLLAEETSSLAVAAAWVPEVVRALREILAERPGLRLAPAARAVGASRRTLQRALRREGTSFRAEVDGARIRAAQALLASSDQKITTVALEVGCTTPQHFSSLFRRITGETPSAWRARQRFVAFS